MDGEEGRVLPAVSCRKGESSENLQRIPETAASSPSGTRGAATTGLPATWPLAQNRCRGSLNPPAAPNLNGAGSASPPGIPGGFTPLRVITGRFLGGCRYDAYVVAGSGGKPVALVEEVSEKENAMYLFRADPSDGWIGVACRTKLDIITGNYPEFIGRVCHAGEWQRRVRDKI